MVLIRGGRVKDLPALLSHCARYARYCRCDGRMQSRSKYGAKRPRAARDKPRTIGWTACRHIVLHR